MDEYANWSARDRAPADDEAGLRAALDEPQPRRRDAALALVDAADDGLAGETTAALEELVATASDAETRQFAIEALGVAWTGRDAIDRDGNGRDADSRDANGRDAIDRDVFVTALTDDEEWVRAEAVVALSRAIPGATTRLVEVLDEDDSGWVRRNALIALAKLDAADEDTFVECIKTDPHPAVREYAAQYLRTGTDSERCVRILAAVLAREPNAFVRVKAAESLGEFGTERARDALADFGIQDASDDVRRTAKRALARARGIDPEALEIEDVSPPGCGPDNPTDRPPAGPTPDGQPVPHRQGGPDEPRDPPSGPGSPPSQSPPDRKER